MLNESIIFGHGQPVIPNHKNLQQTISKDLYSICTKVYDKKNNSEWRSEDEAYFSQCSLITKVSADSSNGSGEAACIDPEYWGARRPCTPIHLPHQLTSQNQERILLGFRDLPFSEHPQKSSGDTCGFPCWHLAEVGEWAGQAARREQWCGDDRANHPSHCFDLKEQVKEQRSSQS